MIVQSSFVLYLFLFLSQIKNSISVDPNNGSFPVIINTWQFIDANVAGYERLINNGSALDAIVLACQKCQIEKCDHTVGWGGSPDEKGQTTLDAMIMDGPTHSVGSVAGLEYIKDVIGVARAVMEHTDHTMLVGRSATNFAIEMGFIPEDLHSNWSRQNHKEWITNNCQPNYWKHVSPDPKKFCGPYKPENDIKEIEKRKVYHIDNNNHDTIGVVAIDSLGKIACGTSTNGANHKIPGRVGDSPIAGAGSYVDQEIGGAAATGDGDVIMRYLLSFKTVEGMQLGMSPKEAAEASLKKVLNKYPHAQIGLVALNMNGDFGGACINIDFFYSIADRNHKPKVVKVKCLPN